MFIFILDVKESKAKAVPAQTGALHSKYTKYFLTHVNLCTNDIHSAEEPNCFTQVQISK